MDVTTSNFGEAIKIIQNLLPNVEYISFDLQFTGLRYENFQRDHINYLPFQKYKKLKYVAETYQILQLGISFVVFDKKLKVYPFNFYLFPRNPVFYDKMLSMQLGCVKFNADNGMDWNKWIREGINYIQLYEMQQLQRNDKNKSFQMILQGLPIENQYTVSLFLRVVDKIGKAQNKSCEIFTLIQPIFRQISTIFYKYIQERNIDVAIKYIPGKSADEEDTIVISKITRSQRQEQKLQRRYELYGFTILFDKIWSMKKAIVGHNCFLDLLYLYQCFIGGLPENYFDFKQLLKHSGNVFYDTKYIAIKHKDIFGQESRLQDLLKTIQKKYPNRLTALQLDNGFNRYSLENPNLHEAGYDSYITAWVYMQMQKLRDDVSQSKNRLNLNFSFFKVNLDKDQDQINQYYAQNLLRINIEIQENEDVKKKRMEIVKRIKESFAVEIENFKAYHIHEGYREIFIEIKQNKREVLKSLKKMKGKLFTDIKTFAGYLEWQEDRVRKTAFADLYRQNRNNHFKEERKFVKTFVKEQSQNEKPERSDKQIDKKNIKNKKQQ